MDLHKAHRQVAPYHRTPHREDHASLPLLEHTEQPCSSCYVQPSQTSRCDT